MTAGMLHCALCGAAATMDAAQDAGWWPEVWVTLTDGAKAIVSACPEHESIEQAIDDAIISTLPVTLESIAANLPFQEYTAFRRERMVRDTGTDLPTVKQYYPDASFLQEWSTAVERAAEELNGQKG